MINSLVNLKANFFEKIVNFFKFIENFVKKAVFNIHCFFFKNFHYYQPKNECVNKNHYCVDGGDRGWSAAVGCLLSSIIEFSKIYQIIY